MTTKDAPPDESGTVNPLVSALRDKLPPILWRADWPKYRREFGLPYCAASMSNLASKGEGPPYGIVARRVFYEREPYLRWLSSLPVTLSGGSRGNGG